MSGPGRAFDKYLGRLGGPGRSRVAGRSRGAGRRLPPTLPILPNPGRTARRIQSRRPAQPRSAALRCACRRGADVAVVAPTQCRRGAAFCPPGHCAQARRSYDAARSPGISVMAGAVAPGSLSEELFSAEFAACCRDSIEGPGRSARALVETRTQG